MYIKPLEGLLCIEILWRIFYVQKTSGGSSMYERPLQSLLCMEDLYILKTFGGSSRH